MVLRYFLQKLLNDPRVIDTLADSAPIRKAAKATAHVIQKAQVAAHEALESETAKIASNIKDNITKDIQKGIKSLGDNNKPK